MYVCPGCAILNETQWCFPDRREEKAMKIGMEELEDLRDGLERLLEFIRGMEQGELPYFYRYFSTMKSNIEMFFCIGCEDIADFFPVLERGFSTVESSINSYKPQKCGIFLSNFIFLYVACVACLWYNGLEVIMIEALF